MFQRLSTFLPLAAAMLLIATQRESMAGPPASTQTVVIVGEMCGACVKQITARLNTFPGIAKVECNIKSKSVTMTPKPDVSLSPKSLWEALDEIGKTPVKLSGPGGTFTSQQKS